MFILLISLCFLSPDLSAGQHGPIDPPVIPQQLLQNRRAPDPSTQNEITSLRALIAQHEHQKTLAPNNATATALLDTRIRIIQKDIDRLEHAANDFTKVQLTPKMVNMLSKVMFAGGCFLYALSFYRTPNSDPLAK